MPFSPKTDLIQPDKPPIKPAMPGYCWTYYPGCICRNCQQPCKGNDTPYWTEERIK